MSALQASRMFNVPSRTLYDKVKKMGIVNARPMNRAIKRSPSNNGSPASFPYGISGTRSPLAHQLESQSHSQTLTDTENNGEIEHREALLQSMSMIDPTILFKAISGGGDIARQALAAANGYKNVRQSSQSPPPVYQGSTSAAPASPSPHDDDDDDDEPRLVEHSFNSFIIT